jgi:hypothetical protein
MTTTDDTFRPDPPGKRVRRISYGQDTDMPGLWLRVGGLSLSEWMEAKWNADLYQLFADRLVEWNMVDENGEPVPCTIDGLKQVDASMIRTLIADWMNRVADVVPLASGRTMPTISRNGDYETSLPMMAPD